jgi:hypothetical protein
LSFAFVALVAPLMVTMECSIAPTRAEAPVLPCRFAALTSRFEGPDQ